MYKKINKIHLVGVGGIGMSGIAEILMNHGYEVSGSDLKGDLGKGTALKGVKVYSGHSAENVEGAELVVYSSAIRTDNPEIVAARDKQVPVISRAEMLAELMRLKYGIAVAGAHGKTTTTSMIATALVEAHLDPTIVVGGRMDNFGGTNARLGKGDFMVVEADESDGSFNKLTPSIAIVTNMDREHMDYYKNMARLKKAFLNYLNKVPFYGLSILCGDDPFLRILQHKVERRKVTYGFSKENHYRVEEYQPTSEGSRSRIRIGKNIETLVLSVPGKHNVLNALAALAVTDELSISRNQSLAALNGYQGVQRRFQKRGEKNGVVFIDDYAHHPTEIRATLSAARDRFPKSKIHVIFQPHRFSRTEDLFDQFIQCFKDCDSVRVVDIYAAGEQPIPGVHSTNLVEGIQRISSVEAIYSAKPLDAVEEILEESSSNDVVLTLGAGDLPNIYRQLF